jgi:hypothetical protein
MKKKLLGTILFGTLLSSGCATILTEDSHNMNVTTSDGRKTTVTVDGQSQAVPGVVSIKKENQDKVLMADAEECTSVNLNKEVESVFFVNILSGGVFGSSTDYGTDKMWRYQDSATIPCN